MSFELHEQLAADCFEVGDLPLCNVLLANDDRYPWFILVPRRADIMEIHQLSSEDRGQLWLESDWLSRELEQTFSPDKLNIAALGNMVPQLHIHHIARFKTDDAWPAPIWGDSPARRYSEETSQQRIEQLQAKLAFFA